MEYYWKSVVYAVPAQLAGERIEELSRRGGVTAAQIVDDARPEGSVLHPAFEWDDSLAAEAWRRQQAKIMLSSLAISVKAADDGGNVEVRAFSNALEEGAPARQAVYVATAPAMRDAGQRSTILANALRELEAYRNKYVALLALAGASAEIERAAERMRKALEMAVTK